MQVLIICYFVCLFVCVCVCVNFPSSFFHFSYCGPGTFRCPCISTTSSRASSYSVEQNSHLAEMRPSLDKMSSTSSTERRLTARKTFSYKGEVCVCVCVCVCVILIMRMNIFLGFVKLLFFVFSFYFCIPIHKCPSSPMTYLRTGAFVGRLRLLRHTDA